MTGTRKVIAQLPVGAYNIQFWFNYKSMDQNFLGKEIMWLSPISQRIYVYVCRKKIFRQWRQSLDNIMKAMAKMTKFIFILTDVN